MLPDYYRILEIGNDASDNEIKKAFHRKVLEFHPSVNKAHNALDSYREVNEAYEILIHHNTRELYEEDFKSWHNPEEYPLYKYWIDAARSRADEHAKLSIDELKKTKFYKSTRTWNSTVFFIGLILGVVTSIAPYIIMAFTDSQYKFIGVATIFLALPAGIFMIVQSLAGFQSMKKFH